MRALFAFVVLLISLQTSGALAQTTITTVQPPPSAFGVDPIVRITTTFRTPIALIDSQITLDANAQEAARRAIYAMAARECAVLSEAFKAECRLGNVLINFPFVAVSPTSSPPPPNYISGTASYELKMAAMSPGL